MARACQFCYAGASCQRGEKMKYTVDTHTHTVASTQAHACIACARRTGICCSDLCRASARHRPDRPRLQGRPRPVPGHGHERDHRQAHRPGCARPARAGRGGRCGVESSKPAAWLKRHRDAPGGSRAGNPPALTWIKSHAAVPINHPPISNY